MPTSRKPLLIVPIRDRRQHRRILTIRNCAISMFVLAVVFAALSIYNQTRRIPEGQYGRLDGSPATVPNNAIASPVDVIDEAPAAYQSSFNPMLVTPAAQERGLPEAVSVPAPEPGTAIAPAPPEAAGAEGHGATIVGDRTGVKMVKPSTTSSAPAPVLAGGIFKQQ